MSPQLRPGGPIGWMARHSVAPNLLMLVLILGGLFFATQIRQEVFPPFEADTVSVSIALPGATPEEVEETVVLAVEEALTDIQDIATLTATANEGAATLIAELAGERPAQVVLNEIDQAVDRITTLPEDAEEPRVRLDVWRGDVIDLLVYGDVDPMSLRMAAEQIRDRLLGADGISQVEIDSAPDLEIQVDISPSALRAYGLTLPEIADTIRRSALDRSGGTLETAGGDLLLRLADRRDEAVDFAQIPLIADPRGTVVRLGDVADVRQGFARADVTASFRGLPALRIEVGRAGAETPIGVSDAVRAVLPEALTTLPVAIDATIVEDDSTAYRARMELLLQNGAFGLVLVLLVLSLFLEFRLAFWVAVGIPTAFLGTLLFLPWADISIYMVSMFAFILALGIVVDDAIVAGENIYEYRQRGMDRLEAAIQGARDIAMPLSFSILTNIVAFIPLAMVPGGFGKFWVVIPIVVATAFLISWLEALFVLPAHLASVRQGRPARLQRALGGGLDWVVSRLYAPLLRGAMHWRYATVALMIAVLAVALAWPLSGRMGFGLFPSVPRDSVRATVSMPVDASAEATLAVRDRMVEAAERVFAENGGEALGLGVFALIDGTTIRLRAYLQGPEARTISTAEFATAWREGVGPMPDARSVSYSSSFGGPGGRSGIQIALSHRDVAVLGEAAEALAARMSDLADVRDAEDGFTPGKRQLEFRLTEAGRAAGLTSDEVARQVRASFFGVEALTQQSGRHEVEVRVRLAEAERRSEGALERLILRLDDGGEIPFLDAVRIERSRADASISRQDGRRVVTVSANVDPVDATQTVVTAVTDGVLPQLLLDYPGLSAAFAGRQATTDQTLESFRPSVALTLLIIYGLLAIPFRSYIQPAIVMAAIPFGFAGAIAGHLIMGLTLSVVSIFGVIALSGVVINAALVMIDYANKALAAGALPFEAIWRAGCRRFRPILLTTVTTFCGLAPMIFETSQQAKFLIPMAVSLGYGIVFATVVVLFLIPCLYLVVEDLRWALRGIWRGLGWAMFPKPPAPKGLAVAEAKEVRPSAPVAAE